MTVELTKEEIEWLLRVCERALMFMEMGLDKLSPVIEDRKKIEKLIKKLTR
jgi:hypothetical protein